MVDRKKMKKDGLKKEFKGYQFGHWWMDVLGMRSKEKKTPYEKNTDFCFDLIWFDFCFVLSIKSNQLNEISPGIVAVVVVEYMEYLCLSIDHFLMI